MPAGANLSVTDQRRATRHPVDHSVIAEHHVRGDVPLHISNISAHGFMVDNASDLVRGDRMMIRLPLIGLIEAYVIWTRDTRAGFQFERIIRADDFAQLIDSLHANPRLRHP